MEERPASPLSQSSDDETEDFPPFSALSAAAPWATFLAPSAATASIDALATVFSAAFAAAPTAAFAAVTAFAFFPGPPAIPLHPGPLPDWFAAEFEDEALFLPQVPAAALADDSDSEMEVLLAFPQIPPAGPHANEQLEDDPFSWTQGFTLPSSS